MPICVCNFFWNMFVLCFLGVKLCKNQNIPNLPISNFVPSWWPRFSRKTNFSLPLSTSRFDQHHSMLSPSWVSGNCNDEIQHTENQGQKPSEFHSTLNEVESWGETKNTFCVQPDFGFLWHERFVWIDGGAGVSFSKDAFIEKVRRIYKPSPWIRDSKIWNLFYPVWD